MRTADENILIGGLRQSWLTLLRECRQRMQSEQFSLDGCLVKVLSGKCDDTFTKEAQQFVAQYQFTETNLATLGVLSWLSLPEDRNKALKDFREGVAQLRRKRPEPSGISYLESGRLLLGLALGAVAEFAQSGKDDITGWAKSCMDGFLKKRPGDMKWQVLGGWAASLLSGKRPAEVDLSRLVLSSGDMQGAALVAVLWALQKQTPTSLRHGDVLQRKCEIVGRLTSLETNRLDILDCAMLAVALEKLSGESARLLPVKDMEYLVSVLQRFPQCLKRERQNLQDEGDVQRILWTMLRSHFDDLVDEEYLKRFGLKNYKLDIGIRSLRTIVEAKFVRPKANLGEVQDQLLADVQGYLQSTNEFDELVMFVYDCSRKLSINTQFVTDLERVQGVAKVIVVPEVQLGRE